MGAQLKEKFNQLVESMNLQDGVSIIGYPPRTAFKFKTDVHKSLFWQECLKKGILFGHAQFINFSHKQQEIDNTVMAMRHALGMVRELRRRKYNGMVFFCRIIVSYCRFRLGQLLSKGFNKKRRKENIDYGN